MSNLRNSVQLIGHLGADPECKKLDTGLMLAKLRLATRETYKSGTTGEWKEETHWHQITAWDGLAERAQRSLVKGSFVMVQGKLLNRSYTDAQGVKKYVTEIRATAILPLDKTTHKEVETTSEPAPEHSDLPF